MSDGPQSALIVKEKWALKLLNGEKSWEIRGSSTSKRGTIAIAVSGTGKLYGEITLVDAKMVGYRLPDGRLVKGDNVTDADFIANNFEKHQISDLGAIVSWAANPKRPLRRGSLMVNGVEITEVPDTPSAFPQKRVVWVNLAVLLKLLGIEYCNVTPVLAMPSLNGNGSQWMRDVRLICQVSSPLAQEIPPPPPPVEAKPTASKPRPRPKVAPKALQEQLQKMPGWAHQRPAEPLKAPPPPPTSVHDETPGLSVKVKPPPKGLNVEEAMAAAVGSKAAPVGPRSRSPVPRPPVKTPPARPAKATSGSTTSVPLPMAPASVPPVVRYSTTAVPVPYNLVGQGSALEQALADETATFLSLKVFS
eukprot:s737_g16.t1